VGHESGPRPGVFGLAHLWFEDEESGEAEPAPLGRVRRAFYYKPFAGDVNERPVRHLGIEPGTAGEPVEGNTDTVLANRDVIGEHLDARLESIREGQVGAAFEQGEKISKEQETVLDFLEQYVIPNEGHRSAPVDGHETVEAWAKDLRDELEVVKLDGMDEDRILRDTFRHNDEYASYGEWPIDEFLRELDAFIEENIEASPEYQDTLVGESAVKARLVCWGVVGR
jgi:hypothetical protein